MSLVFFTGAIDALERVCANYISSSVCLKWSLPTKIEGILN